MPGVAFLDDEERVGDGACIALAYIPNNTYGVRGASTKASGAVHARKKEEGKWKKKRRKKNGTCADHVSKNDWIEGRATDLQGELDDPRADNVGDARTCCFESCIVPVRSKSLPRRRHGRWSKRGQHPMTNLIDACGIVIVESNRCIHHVQPVAVAERGVVDVRGALQASVRLQNAMTSSAAHSSAEDERSRLPHPRGH